MSLTIDFDREQLEKAVASAMGKTISESIQSWEFRNEISKAAAEVLCPSVVAEAISSALSKIDREKLASTMAAVIEETIRNVLTTALEEAGLEVIKKIRGWTDYSNRNEIEAIRNEWREHRLGK